MSEGAELFEDSNPSDDPTFGEGLNQDRGAPTPPPQDGINMIVIPSSSRLYYSKEEGAGRELEGGVVRMIRSQSQPQLFTANEEKLAKKMSVVMRMPNTAFGIALGLGGNAILWKRMQLTDFTSSVGNMGNYFFWYACIIVWVLVSVSYIAKAYFFPSVVRREWSHPVRTHFFNCPHIALLMISIGMPVDNHDNNVGAMRIIFCICIVVQTFLTQRIYRRWLFGKRSNIGQARAPFLLSVIGWLLLSILGEMIDIHGYFGINVSAMCFGAGIFLYLIVVISIFMNLHSAKGEKGSPAMFLILAPPSVACSAIASFSKNQEFGDASCAVFGWCIVVLLLLLSLSPQLLTKPLVLGTCK
jgi:tellurite resistance protein TehA-like permease